MQQLAVKIKNENIKKSSIFLGGGSVNLQQFIKEIENIKLTLGRFGLKKAILYNIGNDEDDDALNYHPIRLCVTPGITSAQISAISFVISQLYNTKFEIQSLDETDDDLLPFLDPKNGVDILGNRQDKIEEMALKIFEISEEELQSLTFSAPSTVNWRHVPEEWQSLLAKERQLNKGLSGGVAEECASTLQKRTRIEVTRIADPVIFKHKRDIPATPPQLHLSGEEESPPRKLAKKLDLVARRSEHPEEFLEIVKSFMELANTPENQRVCLHEIDALITQVRLPKPISFNQ